MNSIAQKIFASLFFLALFISYAQNQNIKHFDLDWNVNNSMAYTRNKFQTVHIKNTPLNENGLPLFSRSWKSLNGYPLQSVEILNPQYVEIDAKSILPEALLHITDTHNIQFSNDTAHHILYNSIQLNPLIKVGNVYKKMVSFDLSTNYSKTIKTKAALKKQQMSSSFLSDGNWYKFAITETGVHKISYQFLKNLGIDVNNINSNHIKVIGNGGAMLPERIADERYAGLMENAIYVVDGNDGVFDQNDYILFYAQGPDYWNYDDPGAVEFVKNIYENKSYYFINVDSGENGLRIGPKQKVTEVSTQRVDTFFDYRAIEEEQINLLGVGRLWFGHSFSSNPNKTYTFEFPNIVNDSPLDIYVSAATSSRISSSLNVSVEGNQLATLNFPNNNSSFNQALMRFVNVNYTLQSDVLHLDLEYNNNGNPSAKTYLDKITVKAERALIATGDQMHFGNRIDNFNTSVYEYVISNKSQIDYVWDVSNKISPQLIEDNNSNSEAYVFKAIGGQPQSYITFNLNNLYEPVLTEEKRIPNQNLHALRDIDYLLITAEELVPAAQRLINHHEQTSGLKTALVTKKQIFNEFSSGSQDITAIRDFVKYLYDNASSNDSKLKYVCLLGDASYDFKDRVAGNTNIVPAYQSYSSFSLAYSYVTDDYYGMISDEDGDMSFGDKQDIATGRILASNLSEANTMVNKIINYDNTSHFGQWHQQITLISDDLKNEKERDLQEGMEEIAQGINQNKPLYHVNKIYADAFQQVKSTGGDSYPDVNKAIKKAMEDGSLIVDYFGHGGEDGLADERMVTIGDIEDYDNYNRAPLFITVTCDFSKFDNPLRYTAGELMLQKPTGGTSLMISTAREVFINFGRNFNLELIEKILHYDGQYKSVASSLLETKNQFSSNSQRYFIYYFGDPAVMLKTPKTDIVITKINDVDVNTERIDLEALSKVKIEGVIKDENTNTVINDYNGVLYTSIYDKPIQKATLDNDNMGVVMNFESFDSKIFKGKAQVENGQFQFEFVVPKDIKLNKGNGKIVFYTNKDQLIYGGADLNTVIGGLNADAPLDQTGPSIKVYLNDESFVEGGVVDQDANLLVFLEDEHGINTSLGAVGHQITAVIDGDTEQTIVLNDAYESEIGDYTKGKINYPLVNLEPGSHTLEIKAFDTHNNSSQVTLSFEVRPDRGIQINRLLNYPNPMIGHTEFWFEHNRQGVPLEAMVQIFTISGKLVKTIRQNIQTLGELSREMVWNGKDDFGQKVGKGVYFYKLTLKDVQGGTVKEKLEKLVILQ